jgi:hypothetical protein
MTAPRSAPARGHWLPSIPAIVFIGILVFVVAVFQEPLLNSDGDLARHLRHGEWMLQHRRLVTADPFSYTRGGQPFVAFEYGGQLAYAVAHRAGGLAAVTIFAALLIAAAYALLTRFMLRRGVEPLFAGLITTAAIITGMGHWLARPHLFTLVAVPLLLELLSPAGKWRTWPFAVLFAIWVNLHGGFVYGLVLIGIFLAAAAIDALRSPGGPLRSAAVRRYAGALGLGAASALANPWGVGVYRHIVAMFGDHYIIDHTAEFASPDFHDLASKFFLLLLVGVLAAAFLGRKAPTLTVIMTVAGVYLALVHQRNTALFGLTALPFIAIYLDPAWRSLRFFGGLRHGVETGAAGASTTGWVGMAAALALALGITHGRVGSRQWVVNAFSPDRLPLRAVSAARSARLSGRVFSDFGWGGYLLYAWPDQKVFIDGGTDFYGGGLMREYSIIRGVQPGWWDLVQRWNFALMIVSTEAPIASELTRDHGWRYWYCDPTAVVLLRGDIDAPPPRTGAPSPEACAPDMDREIGAS